MLLNSLKIFRTEKPNINGDTCNITFTRTGFFKHIRTFTHLLNTRDLTKCDICNIAYSEKGENLHRRKCGFYHTDKNLFESDKPIKT